MIKVMDMSTGKILEDEFGSFQDEVLGAGWITPQPELQLGLQSVALEAAGDADIDTDAFLNKIYTNQA